MKELEESVYTVIAPKKNEILANDPLISKGLIAIFKTEISRGPNNTTIPITYLWTEAEMGSYVQHEGIGKVFLAYRSIGPEDFAPSPILPSNLKSEIVIDSKDKMNELINDGYDVKVYTNARQYRKDMAHYFIANKALYHKEHLNDEEIWDGWMNPSKIIREPSEIENKVYNSIETIIAE